MNTQWPALRVQYVWKFQLKKAWELQICSFELWFSEKRKHTVLAPRTCTEASIIIYFIVNSCNSKTIFICSAELFGPLITSIRAFRIARGRHDA